MFETIRYLIAAILLVIGVAAAAVSILGVFRFRFVMNRMHCAAIVDTLSMAAICGGLMVATGSMDYIPKLLKHQFFTQVIETYGKTFFDTQQIS